MTATPPVPSQPIIPSPPHWDTLSRLLPCRHSGRSAGGHRFGDGRLCRDLYRCLAGQRVWTTPHGIWLRPGSGRDYADLLADETYWTAALTERVSLDIPVTVYRFSDSPAPEGQRAATRAVTVTPGADTTILTYGFNGYGESEGLPQYSYFLRENRAVSPMLIVLGTDLQDYALAGYTDGGCEETLDLGPCTVTRSETTLEAVLQELCQSILDHQGGTGRQGLRI